MARPPKSGLDYFPLDVDMDDKIELIEAKHGLVGFGVIIKLLQAIYKNGFYLEASDDRLLLMSKRINVNINELNAIIADAITRKLFDEKIYNKFNVLTSCGIQKRYAEAIKRRKEITVDKKYCLICFETVCGDRVNVNINKENVDINSENDDSSTQRKVKESKDIYPSNFLKFWNHYPKKIGKGAALKAYQTIKEPKPSLSTILQSIELHKTTEQWKTMRYIPNPATWLNQRRWEDEIQQPINGTTRKTSEQIHAELKEALS
jgi:hypothetical protein